MPYAQLLSSDQKQKQSGSKHTLKQACTCCEIRCSKDNSCDD